MTGTYAPFGYREPCCPIEVNARGQGPEMDPRKVTSTLCLEHGWETWPCRFDGTPWHLKAQVGAFDDGGPMHGHPWQRWYVYLDGEELFVSPALDLALEGIEDYIRTGAIWQGAADPACTCPPPTEVGLAALRRQYEIAVRRNRGLDRFSLAPRRKP